MKHISLVILLVLLTLSACDTSNDQMTEEQNSFDPSSIQVNTSTSTESSSENESGVFEINEDTITLPGEDFALTMKDDFQILNSNIVRFGPKGVDPESSADDQSETFYYSMSIGPKRNFDDINEIFIAIQTQRNYSLAAETHEFNGIQAVRWAVGGACDRGFMEILGQTQNLVFSTIGCQTKTFQEDFDYFESLFE